MPSNSGVVFGSFPSLEDFLWWAKSWGSHGKAELTVMGAYGGVVLCTRPWVSGLNTVRAILFICFRTCSCVLSKASGSYSATIQFPLFISSQQYMVNQAFLYTTGEVLSSAKCKCTVLQQTLKTVLNFILVKDKRSPCSPDLPQTHELLAFSKMLGLQACTRVHDLFIL